MDMLIIKKDRRKITNKIVLEQQRQDSTVFIMLKKIYNTDVNGPKKK